MKRRRHLPTVALVDLQARGDRLLGSPAAQASTMRARKLSAAGIERDRAIDSTALARLRQHQLRLRPSHRHRGISVPKIPKTDARHMPVINGTGHYVCSTLTPVIPDSSFFANERRELAGCVS